MPRIYLDSAASAPPAPGLIGFFSGTASELYANQEALHLGAFEIRERISKAAETISAELGGREGSTVLWAHTATDSFNVLASFPGFSSATALVTRAEHPALLSALKRCFGTRLKFVPLKPDASIDLAGLKALADEKTLLAAFHHVQGETGFVQDISAIRKILDECAPHAVFMADTVQSACRIDIPPDLADIVLVSGHKTGAPGGAALICKRKHVTLCDFLESARKEHLCGRPNPALLLTLAESVVRMNRNRNKNLAQVSALNLRLRESLSAFESLDFTLPAEKSSPYILHFTLSGYQGAVLVRMLSERGLMLSSGSACESESGRPSEVLSAMGFNRERAYSGLRVSLWHDTSQEDIDRFVSALRDCIKGY